MLGAMAGSLADAPRPCWRRSLRARSRTRAVGM